jgi:hypothetical protein
MPSDVKLTETELLRSTIRQAIEEEGLDTVLRACRLICDIEWRAHEAAGKGAERLADRWRARGRFLANMVTMASRVEGRES